MSTTETISLPRNLPKRKVVSQAVATDYAFIKKLIWAYFLLLLFEGALRKWFLPGLSQGLLIIRDPTCDLDLLPLLCPRSLSS